MPPPIPSTNLNWPPAPCPYQFWYDGNTPGVCADISAVTLVMIFPPLAEPFLVVTMMTPLAAREP